ncbi:MAG: hypothetical protein WKF87_09775 [Chryseolinea sp.]
MKTLRFLTIAFSICCFAACTPKNDDRTQSETSTPTEEGPGVGAAPDNSQSVDDSLTQQADTTSLKKPD